MLNQRDHILSGGAANCEPFRQAHAAILIQHLGLELELWAACARSTEIPARGEGGSPEMVRPERFELPTFWFVAP
jgi:hypothetical protein